VTNNGLAPKIGTGQLIGGSLIRQRRVLLLNPLILRLEFVIFALRDTDGKEDGSHEREQQDAAFRIICHSFEFPLLIDKQSR
jgi:hypothetical protein